MERYYEEIQTDESTLMNFYLMKIVHTFLEKRGKRLETVSKSLMYDWGNCWGYHPYEVFTDLLKLNFNATTKYCDNCKLEDFELYSDKFFPHMVDVEDELLIVHFDLPIQFNNFCGEVTPSKKSEEYGILDIFREEESFYVNVEERTIIFVHRKSEFSEYNLVGMFEFIFEQLEGREL